MASTSTTCLPSHMGRSKSLGLIGPAKHESWSYRAIHSLLRRCSYHNCCPIRVCRILSCSRILRLLAHSVLGVAEQPNPACRRRFQLTLCFSFQPRLRPGVMPQGDISDELL